MWIIVKEPDNLILWEFHTEDRAREFAAQYPDKVIRVYNDGKPCPICMKTTQKDNE